MSAAELAECAFKPLQGIAARLLRDYRMHTRVFWIVSCAAVASRKDYYVHSRQARRSFVDRGIIGHFNEYSWTFSLVQKPTRQPIN